MAGLTEELARFVANPGLTPLPPAAVEIAKSGFIDAAGVLVRGQTDQTVQIARHYATQTGQMSVEESSLFFGKAKGTSEAVTLINGIACHIHDYDDVGLRAHPSAILVPTILAEAERLKKSGADALRAYIVGFEVWAELNAREPGDIHFKGWHPTSTVGTLGAAAAAASLNGFDMPKARNTLAIAASMAAGVVANFGSMTKSFQVGRAAACGVQAARLAALGMTGSPDALEHNSGLLAAMSPLGDANRANPIAPIGKALRLVENGLSFKKYPVCYCAHRVIDAVIDMAKAEDIKPGDVDSVDVRIGVTQHSLLRNQAPQNVLEAKFSIEFAIAAGLVSRSVGLGELETSYVLRPEIQSLMTKVKVEEDPSICPIEPAFSMNDRLKIKLKNGLSLDSGEIRFSRGHARLPLGPGELKQKFLDCCRDARDLDANRLFDMLSSLETLPDMASLPQR
jgi:2-methylcitrate dehydratase PrpD